MNETFTFSRFWKYFLYDLKQMWRRNSRAILLIGCASVILYIVAVTVSLVFQHVWQAPPLAVRAVVFSIAALALFLYQTRTYGYLTERKAGSSWLMIPASTTEKFVSMMVITLLVLPIAFAVVYMATDALIVLLDPTATDPLISSISSLIGQADAFMQASGEMTGLSLSVMIFPVILQLCMNLLYFLLCGLCFKRWKLVGAFAILFGVQFLLTSLGGIIALHPESLEWLKDNFSAPETAAQAFRMFMTWANVINALLALGLGAGIFYRLKTLKH